MRDIRERALDILVHQYFAIDTDIVWSVVENDLPRLKAQFQTILSRQIED